MNPCCGGGRGAGGRGAPQVKLPFTRPETILHTDDWNQIEIFLDANIVRSHLNNANTNTGELVMNFTSPS